MNAVQVNTSKSQPCEIPQEEKFTRMATGGQSYRLAIHYPLNNEGDVTKRVRVPWGERNIQSLANNGREWIKGCRYLRKTGERMRKKKYFFYLYMFFLLCFSSYCSRIISDLILL